MYVRKQTWLESGPRRGGLGLGQPGCVCVTSPCHCAPAETWAPIPPANGEWFKDLKIEGVCLTPLFPWFGRRVSVPDASICQPVFTVPDPWGMVATVAIGGLVAFKVLRGILR